MRISDWSSDVCASDLEVTEKRPLGQSHSLGDGRRCDVARVLFRSQVDHRLHGRRPSLVSGEMPGTPIHCLRFRKLVIYYYLSAICARCKMEPPKGNVMTGKGGRGGASGQVTACPSSLSRVGRGCAPTPLPA